MHLFVFVQLHQIPFLLNPRVTRRWWIRNYRLPFTPLVGNRMAWHSSTLALGRCGYLEFHFKSSCICRNSICTASLFSCVDLFLSFRIWPIHSPRRERLVIREKDNYRFFPGDFSALIALYASYGRLSRCYGGLWAGCILAFAYFILFLNKIINIASAKIENDLLIYMSSYNVVFNLSRYT